MAELFQSTGYESDRELARHALKLSKLEILATKSYLERNGLCRDIFDGNFSREVSCRVLAEDDLVRRSDGQEGSQTDNGRRTRTVAARRADRD